MRSEIINNLRFLAALVIVIVMFHLSDLIEMMKTDFGVFIGTFMMGSILAVVPLVLLTIVHSEPDDDDNDDDEEMTDAARVLCQLRQVEQETAVRNEQRRSAYALRSSTKRD